MDAGFAHTSTSRLVRHAMVGHPWRVRLGSFDDFGSVVETQGTKPAQP